MGKKTAEEQLDDGVKVIPTKKKKLGSKGIVKQKDSKVSDKKLKDKGDKKGMTGNKGAKNASQRSQADASTQDKTKSQHSDKQKNS